LIDFHNSSKEILLAIADGTLVIRVTFDLSRVIDVLGATRTLLTGSGSFERSGARHTNRLGVSVFGSAKVRFSLLSLLS
jgi:hypothetical protein